MSPGTVSVVCGKSLVEVADFANEEYTDTDTGSSSDGLSNDGSSVSDESSYRNTPDYFDFQIRRLAPAHTLDGHGVNCIVWG